MVINDTADDSSRAPSRPDEFAPIGDVAAPSQDPTLLGHPDFADREKARGGVFGVSIRRGNARDALIAKMTPKQISEVIASEDKAGERQHIQSLVQYGLTVFSLIALLGTILLSVAFLMFNKPEYLQGILGLVMGLLGGGATGFGLGRATAPKTSDGSGTR